MTFQFDTSGCVELENERPLAPEGEQWWMPTRKVRWIDLTPCEQGYVGAMFEGLLHISFNEPTGELPWKPMNTRNFCFSDLASETLERIMEDCEHAPKVYRDFGESVDQENAG